MCDGCNETQDYIFKDQDDKWYLRVENGNWNFWNDGFDYTDIQVDYCPYCGRKLE